MPVPKFKVLEDGCNSLEVMPSSSSSYRRWISSSSSNLNKSFKSDDIDYEVDEVDTSWLELINRERNTLQLQKVPVDVLELLMDRLEKHSFLEDVDNNCKRFQIEDEAVCCICMVHEN